MAASKISTAQVRREICAVGRRMWMKGLGAGFDGNVSVRVGGGGGDRVLCTPTGVMKGELLPGMIVEVDLEGKGGRGKGKGLRATSEIGLHLAIYRRRPDVGAVVHAHGPAAVAFCCARVPLPEGVYPEADAYLGRVPLVGYVTPGRKELGELVAAAIGEDTNTVLMANHGSVSFGRTLTEAYSRLEVLEAYCKILLMMKQLGGGKHVGAEKMRELLELKISRGGKDSRMGEVEKIGERNGEFFGS